MFAKAATPALVVGRPASLWATAGSPGAGSFDASLNGVVLSSSSSNVAGQLPHTDPVSGNAYLGRLQAQASQPGTLILCDRLWHNGGYTITATTAQNSTPAAWPARDVAGSTNGDGVLLGVEYSANAGAAAPTFTIAYTNEAGTASRSAVNLDATANSSLAGSFYRIGLQAGDKGVRTVASLTMNVSQVTGTINLVAYRPLAALELSASNVPNAIDALTGGIPRLFNGIVPFFLFVPSTAAAMNLSGTYAETQG